MAQPKRSSSHRPAGLRGKAGTVATVALVVLGIGVLIYRQTRPSAEDLLNADTLTPDQIRYVATHLLVDDDIQLRSRASQKLVSLGESAVPVLKDLSLNSKDSAVRKAVLDILLALQPKGVDQIVGQMLADRDAEVRRIAANAASALPPAQSAPVILQSLKDSDSGVRAAAIDSLARRQDPANIPALQEAMHNDASPTVRRHAKRVIEMMTGQKIEEPVKRD